MLLSSAIDPLPDIGRSSAIGTASAGRPIRLVTGSSAEVIISRAPDALNISTAVMSPTSVGTTDIMVGIPLFAPSIKLSKTLIRQTSPAAMKSAMTEGII